MPRRALCICVLGAPAVGGQPAAGPLQRAARPLLLRFIDGICYR